ncbi:MAG: hypothetical protein ACFFGZ_03180 [Candidatus Thorarchaeota archaeon]
MGLRRIEEKIAKEAALREKGAQVAMEELEQWIDYLKKMQKDLQKFEKDNAKVLETNPAAAERLMAFRRELGLPEKLGVFEAKTSPSFSEKLTGKGEFYEQLGLQVLELGKKKLAETGGIVSLSEIVLEVNRNQKTGYVVSPTDIVRTVNTLKENKLISGVRQLDSGMRIVEFIDPQLSGDTEKILQVASSNPTGELSLDALVVQTQWPLERVKRTMDLLKDKKIVQEKKTLDGIRYFFAGLG